MQAPPNFTHATRARHHARATVEVGGVVGVLSPAEVLIAADAAPVHESCDVRYLPTAGRGLTTEIRRYCRCQSDGRVGLTGVRRLIEHSNSRFSEAVRSQDLDQVCAFYSEDAVLLVGDSPAARGRDQIAAWFTHAFAAGLTELAFETQDVRPFSELVIEEGAYRMIAGNSTQRGRYVVVHQCNAEGVWQALYDVVQPG